LLSLAEIARVSAADWDNLPIPKLVFNVAQHESTTRESAIAEALTLQRYALNRRGSIKTRPELVRNAVLGAQPADWAEIVFSLTLKGEAIIALPVNGRGAFAHVI
jgi:hypothetical protein